MKAKLIQEQGEKTFAVVFDKGDECMAGLLDFAKQQSLVGAHFSAIGAFSDVTLGFFDRQRMEYKKIPVGEQVEVLSLVGNVALDDGSPKVHAHVVVGKSDGSAHGGHILDAHVWPTPDVIVIESPKHLQRKTEPETGLALIGIAG